MLLVIDIVVVFGEKKRVGFFGVGMGRVVLHGSSSSGDFCNLEGSVKTLRKQYSHALIIENII